MRLIQLTQILLLHTLTINASQIHEKRILIGSEWKNQGRLPASAQVVVRVALQQSNLHRAHNLLMDIAHPDSTNYGQHWSASQVIDMFAPSDIAIAAVREWLIGAGIDESRLLHTENKGWIVFVTAVGTAENLFSTKYYRYRHKSDGKTAVLCEEYSLPRSVQPHIDYIHPGIAVPVRHTHTKRGEVVIHGELAGHKPLLEMSLACDDLVTPDCIAALYRIPKAPLPPVDNPLGIFQTGNYYAQEDLDLFFRNLSPHIPAGTHPTPAFINGAEAPVPVSDAGLESDLDLQVAYPLIYPQNITLYQTDDQYYSEHGNRGFLNTLLDAIDGSYCTSCAFGQCGDDPERDPVYPNLSPGGYRGERMCGVYQPTNVISISYAGPETNFPASYQRRQCLEYLKLGLQGVTVLFPSGDNGVAGPDGCLGPEQTIFSPSFPNNCPYVTSVGGTTIREGKETALERMRGETVLSSGGGFSNIYPMPDYQAQAVNMYLQHYPPSFSSHGNSETVAEALFNRSGRAYPDVAAVGDNLAVVYRGLVGSTGGTSASTPIFAAIINRIIDERLAIGKGPLGFLNPVLYRHPWVLTDITNGSNPGCGTDGFSAATGWDPVTGLGTPNYPKMLELFLNLP
ncbi:hypothetical protein ASPZODRAFT_77390 [Penicilliopsis zonata CBS 506.65]|uniref:tripeptidyl-peptidase II n=1 Tax=Penicilliopsis zonata CBS 506.65 TaxID=1073090 RepID=A0A1L9S526_9EURO|nr:hypothetical protein ASPZODRAFT_77390 [Penicilliopsis zonata CBS 506.65]OJJ42265.1 hypothetical protein ASPZODRAFT_77390 [Penicilliopsis zonata CBS 506.65]